MFKESIGDNIPMKCNFCKEEINNDAVTCQHCNANKYTGITIWQSILILNGSYSLIFILCNILGVMASSSAVFALIISSIIYVFLLSYYHEHEYWLKQFYFLNIIRNAILIIIPIMFLCNASISIFSLKIIDKIHQIYNGHE